MYSVIARRGVLRPTKQSLAAVGITASKTPRNDEKSGLDLLRKPYVSSRNFPLWENIRDPGLQSRFRLGGE